MRPASLRIRSAANYELLAVKALQLDPDAAVARRIGLIGALGDGALEAEFAGLGAELRTAASDVLAVAQPGNLLLEQAV